MPIVSWLPYLIKYITLGSTNLNKKTLYKMMLLQKWSKHQDFNFLKFNVFGRKKTTFLHFLDFFNKRRNLIIRRR